MTGWLEQRQRRSVWAQARISQTHVGWLWESTCFSVPPVLEDLIFAFICAQRVLNWRPPWCTHIYTFIQHSKREVAWKQLWFVSHYTIVFKVSAPEDMDHFTCMLNKSLWLSQTLLLTCQNHSFRLICMSSVWVNTQRV